MSERFRKIVQEQIRREARVQTRWADVVNVDWEAKTMTASANGLEYYDVLLGIGCISIRPQNGARALLGLIENKQAATFLIMCDKVEGIELNGPDHGGLLIYEKLFTEMDKEKQRVDKLYDAIKNGQPVAQDGGVAYQQSMKLILQTAPQAATYNEQLINDTVKHG